jgi:hypothetical protein
LVLRCLADTGHGWGKVSLINILRASSRAPEAGRKLRTYGALSSRPRSAVEALIERLLNDGFLSTRVIPNIGTVLDLTTKGQAALRNPTLLEVVTIPHSRQNHLPD